MLTLLEIIKRTTEYFDQRGVESPRLNAELIVGHALGLDRMQIYLRFEQPLSDAELERIRPLVRRRGQREPLAYVLGEAPFGDLMLKVDARVLVPRPETEQLLELVRDLAALPAPESAVLDLGTGSGALAFGLAQAFPAARIVAVDANEAALELARENAGRLGLVERVSFRKSDWFAAFTPGVDRFAVIVANPPYLSETEWRTAEPEVREHEPKAALVAEEEGAADLLRIIAEAPRFLEPAGWLFLETGIAQHERLLRACAAAGLRDARSHQDWSSRDRFVTVRAT